MTARIGTEKGIDDIGVLDTAISIDQVGDGLRLTTSPKLLHSAKTDNAYYAGFNSTFVGEVLKWLDLPRGSIIADPWTGSGTTAVEAIRQGYRFVGIDLNPTMVVAARAQLASLTLRGLRPTSLPDTSELDIPPTSEDDPICAWLTRRSASHVRYLQSLLSQRIRRRKIRDMERPLLAASLQQSLCFALKQLVSTRRSTNPSWNSPSKRVSIDPSALSDLFQLAQSIAHSAQPQAEDEVEAEVFVGDSRRLTLANASVDAVVTSPPYCTRLDYSRATAFELALLGPLCGVTNQALLRDLRRSMMGTTMIRSHDEVVSLSSLPLDIQDLVASIVDHPSYASRRYYGPWFRQYCLDAYQSVSEIARILRPGGRCILVVQDSYYKDVHIALDRMFASLGRWCGLKLDLSSSWVAPHVLAMSNPRSRAYASQDRTYLEHAVCLTKESDDDPERN